MDRGETKYHFPFYCQMESMRTVCRGYSSPSQTVPSRRELFLLNIHINVSRAGGLGQIVRPETRMFRGKNDDEVH